MSVVIPAEMPQRRVARTCSSAAGDGREGERQRQGLVEEHEPALLELLEHLLYAIGATVEPELPRDGGWRSRTIHAREVDVGDVVAERVGPLVAWKAGVEDLQVSR